MGVDVADFRTHISVSTAAGVAYGAAGYGWMEMPLATSIIAGSLCSVAGMLPDLDSDSGRPVREMVCFGAAAIPMFLFDRVGKLSCNPEEMVVFGAAMYVLIRFVGGAILKKCTVHRGMFHSIPALVIAFLSAYLICQNGDVEMRLFKAGGVALGFFSHLLLDEIWSIQWTGLGPRVKKSFGTALKFSSDNTAASSFAYALVMFVGFLAYQDFSQTPTRMAERPTESIIDRIGTSFFDTIRR